MKGRWVALLGIAAVLPVLIGAFVYILSRTGSGVDSAEALLSAEVIAEDAVVAEAFPRRRGAASDVDGVAVGPVASSLQGTDIDGGFQVDAAGDFIADQDALDLFAYFFSTLGEVGEEIIIARIHAQISARLAPPARAQAEVFFKQYLRYREQLKELASGTDQDHWDYTEYLDTLSNMRRQVFGAPLARQLFGEEEQAALIAIRKQAIGRDKDLSPQQRRALRAAWDQYLPPQEYQFRQRQRDFAQAANRVERARQDGATDLDIWQLRAQWFDAEAADRYAQLDRDRAHWQARLADYRGQVDRILTANLSGEEKRRRIDALRARHFSGAQLTRVTALDELDIDIQ